MKIFCNFAHMKAIQGTIFRIIVAFVVGALLIKYRSEALTWVIMAIGGLFFLSGVFSCLGYWQERRKLQKAAEGQFDAEGNPVRPRLPFAPIVGVGSLILGAILVCMPDTFAESVAFIMAAILILGAVSQFVALGMARRYAKIPVIYWLFPIIILLVSAYVLVNPIDALSTPLLIIGLCMVFYAVVELLNLIQIHRMRKTFEKQEELNIAQSMHNAADAEDAEIIPESEA